MEHLIPPVIFWLELPKKKTLTGEAFRRRPNQMSESPPPLGWLLLTWRSSRSPLRAPSESQSSLAEFPIPPVMPLINSRYVCVGVADEIQIRLYSGEEMLLSWGFPRLWRGFSRWMVALQSLGYRLWRLTQAALLKVFLQAELFIWLEWLI